MPFYVPIRLSPRTGKLIDVRAAKCHGTRLTLCSRHNEGGRQSDPSLSGSVGGLAVPAAATPGGSRCTRWHVPGGDTDAARPPRHSGGGKGEPAGDPSRGAAVARGDAGSESTQHSGCTTARSCSGETG